MNNKKRKNWILVRIIKFKFAKEKKVMIKESLDARKQY